MDESEVRGDVHHTRRPHQVPLHRQIEAQKALKLAARLNLAARLKLAGATAQGGAQLWEIMRELCPHAAAQARRIVRRLVIPVGRGRRGEHLHAAAQSRRVVRRLVIPVGRGRRGEQRGMPRAPRTTAHDGRLIMHVLTTSSPRAACASCLWRPSTGRSCAL